MKSKLQKVTVWLGIRVLVISPPTVSFSSVGKATSLAQVVKGLKRHKVAKYFYFPLRGIPNGCQSFSICGNHLTAFLGEADMFVHNGKKKPNKANLSTNRISRVY